MKRIFIKKELFDLDKTYSLKLISSIINLYKFNYDIYLSEEVDKNFSKILTNEEVSYNIHNPKTDIKTTLLLYNEKVLLRGLGESKNELGFDNIFEAVKFLINERRSAEIRRRTNETNIKININLDGTGQSEISTGLGFFDHMLEQIAKHSNSDLEINVEGDLRVDEHHTVEDTGLALGEAIIKALGDKKGIKRFGYFVPMDDSHAHCSIDLSGRPYLKYKCKFSREMVGEFPTELAEEFFKSLANGMKSNIFIRAGGKNDHHKIEAMFKCFAKALNEACRMDERNKNQLPSTKGTL